MTIYDTTLPEVNQLKGGVITSIIKGTLVKALHCGEINACMGRRGVGMGNP